MRLIIGQTPCNFNLLLFFINGIIGLSDKLWVSALKGHFLNKTKIENNTFNELILDSIHNEKVMITTDILWNSLVVQSLSY